MSTTRAGVDWDLATSTAIRLVRPGPELGQREVADVVAELRDGAARAQSYVAEVTRLHTDPTQEQAPVLVVDRPSWIRANVDAFATIMGPLTERMAESGSGSPAWVGGLGARATGVEVGVLLSYLATKVLGQYDPYADLPGRLMLVAPNVAEVERELEVPHADFRFWVCLHEETHRVQFTAVPWLRDHLRGLVAEVVGTAELGWEGMAEMITSAARRIGQRRPEDAELSLVELLQTPQQRELVDRITAIMTLLEGHADYMMDQVGPEVIGSIVQIRAKFSARRESQGLDKIIRRLLGLDAKIRQYRDGAAFCTTVIDTVGLDRFNRVWDSPDTLPTRDEIAHPQYWIDRVVGPAGSVDPAA